MFAFDYLLVVWFLIIWLLKLNFFYGKCNVRVDVVALAGMLLCHRLDLLLDAFVNLGSVHICLECRDVAVCNMQQ
jgi:hypothetical protein